MLKHVLADGRVLDDISGYEVRRCDDTEPAYRIVISLMEKGDMARNKDYEKEVMVQ